MPGHTEVETTRFLPDIALESAEGTPVRLRPPAGEATVLVAMHSADCPGCRDYVEALAGSAAEFLAWGARLLIVVPGPAQGLLARFGRILSDPEQRVSSPGDAAVVVSDRYGHIYDVQRTGTGHHFPRPRQLEEWLKFLATLCPE